MEKKEQIKKVMFVILLALLLSGVSELFFLLIEKKIWVNQFLIPEFTKGVLGSFELKRIVMMALIFGAMLGVFVSQKSDSILKWIFEKRYFTGFFLLAFCVIFELHGSSIQCWQNYFQNSEAYSAIIGVARSIRSDEWAVNTPMALSQYLNGAGAFPYFSETIRGTLTDVFIVYGQPVRDIAVIFRPFHWGYLLLEPAKGLSFFWCGRLIGLFLISFEFGRILTKDKRVLALSYAILVTFAPAIQWWFAINGFVEMLIFGQLAIILINLYMKKKDIKYRIAIGLGLVIIAGGYILTFYPAWQIAFGYVFLALFISLWIENYPNFHWDKKDILIIGCSFLLLGIGLIYIFGKSNETITAVMNTAYPGNRLELGGTAFEKFFMYPGNLFFPLSMEVAYANVCELAVFFDFFPLGILAAFWVLLKENRKDPFLIVLLIVNAVLISWCIFHWPEWLAKITLLSNSNPNRTFLAVGLINLLLLFRAATLIRTKPSKIIRNIVVLVFGVLIVSGSVILYDGYLDLRLGLISLMIVLAAFFMIVNIKESWSKKGLLIMSVIIAFVAGAFVNPVVSGLDVIEEQPIMEEIKAITQQDNGLWIYESGEDNGFPTNNFLLMAGAPVINSTNVYPDLERWKLLDPEGEYIDIYNRYAHISVNLSDSEEIDEPFVLMYTDNFTVNVNLEDLQKLGVSYVLTKRDLEGFELNETYLDLLGSENGFNIYKVMEK